MTLSKYCASGNDFLIFHTFKEEDRSKMAITLCDRYYGIGADGLAVLLPLNQQDDTFMQGEYNNINYKLEFYNCDGSLANMCGNASRAIGLYAYHNNINTTDHSFISRAGIISIEIIDTLDDKSSYVKSKLGKFSIEDTFIERRDNNIYEFNLITITIPHLVCLTTSLKDYLSLSNDIEFLSKLRHKYNANVNVAFKNNDRIYYSTFERGVEKVTKACGSGACAVYIAVGDMENEQKLIPPSKEILKVSCLNHEIYFSGLVGKVCDCIV